MSYALYVGRNHTADGIAYLAGYGDEPSSHWLEVVPAADHAPGTVVTVGVKAVCGSGLFIDVPYEAGFANQPAKLR